MSSDEVEVKTPLFSFFLKKRDHSRTIKEGETIIMRYWNWRSFGYRKKAVSLKNGVIEVQVID